MAAKANAVLLLIVSFRVTAAPVPPPLDPVASTSCPEPPEARFHCWVSKTKGEVVLMFVVTVDPAARASTSKRPSFVPVVANTANAVVPVPVVMGADDIVPLVFTR